MAADRIIDEAADAPLSGIIMIAYPRGRSAAEGWAWIDGAGHDDPAMGAILDAMEARGRAGMIEVIEWASVGCPTTDGPYTRDEAAEIMGIDAPPPSARGPFALASGLPFLRCGGTTRPIGPRSR